MSNNLSDIISVQIEIQSPALDSADFGTMLIVGYVPKTKPKKDPPAVGVYTSLKAVEEAGWRPKDGNKEADAVYLAANVAFAQSPQPTKVYIAVRKSISGVPDTFEPVTDTLNRALDKSGWYAVVPAGLESTVYDDLAQWVEANEKIMGITSKKIGSELQLTSYLRTFEMYGKIGEDEEITTPPTNDYINVAWCGDCLSYEPGSETWALKTLSLTEPAELSGIDMKDLQDAKISYYTTYAGKNVTQGGKTVAGEWIDVIRFRDWLKNEMQLELFNLLYTRPKLPYTNQGIALIENRMTAVLKRGQRMGGIAPDEFDEDGKLIPGFTVTVPNSMSISSAQKASRILKGCKFHARIAGAIHVIEVMGTLAYEDKETAY